MTKCCECDEMITEDEADTYCAGCRDNMPQDCANTGADGFDYCQTCIDTGEDQQCCELCTNIANTGFDLCIDCLENEACY